MTESFWYKEKFFRPEKEKDVLVVGFTSPMRLVSGDWKCEVSIEHTSVESFEVRGTSSFQVMQLTFARIRKVILEECPEYLHDGDERVAHLIPRPIEWFYGDEIRLKTEAFMDDLRTAKNDEIRQKWLTWARANPAGGVMSSCA